MNKKARRVDCPICNGRTYFYEDCDDGEGRNDYPVGCTCINTDGKVTRREAHRLRKYLGTEHLHRRDNQDLYA